MAYSTNQKAHFRYLLALLGLFILTKILFAYYLQKPLANASDLTITNILQAVNQQRQLRNLVLLNTDSRLSAAAQSKADDMQARHYFAHVDPDGNYIWPKIVSGGYTPYLQLGENLAIDFYDTDSLMAAWMNSPTHRANILNDGFKDQGMGLNLGDTASNQYYSTVANTFGALLVSKKTSAAAQPAPSAPISQPTVKPATPKLAAPVAGSSAPTTPPAPKTTTSVPSPPATPISPRGFALGSSQQSAASSAPISAGFTELTPAAQAPTTSPPVINQPPQVTPVQSYQINRLVTFAFGLLLLAYLFWDLRRSSDEHLLQRSKKINNLAVLILALVVVAVMYWL